MLRCSRGITSAMLVGQTGFAEGKAQSCTAKCAKGRPLIHTVGACEPLPAIFPKRNAEPSHGANTAPFNESYCGINISARAPMTSCCRVRMIPPMKMILMLKLIMKNSALAVSTIFGRVIWP